MRAREVIELAAIRVTAKEAITLAAIDELHVY